MVLEQMEQEKLAEALHGLRPLAPTTSQPLYPMWLPPISAGPDTFVTPDFGNGPNLYPELREYPLSGPSPADVGNDPNFMPTSNEAEAGSYKSLPPGTRGDYIQGATLHTTSNGVGDRTRLIAGTAMPDTLDLTSSRTTLVSSDSGDRGRESPQSQMGNQNGGAGTRDNSHMQIDTDHDFIDSDDAPTHGFAVLTDDHSNLGSKWQKNHQIQGSTEHGNGFSEYSNDAHWPRGRIGESGQNQSRMPRPASSTTRSSSTFEFTPGYDKNISSDESVTFVFGNQSAASGSPNAIQKRRRLELGQSEQQNFDHDAENHRTRDYRFDSESSRASVQSVNSQPRPESQPSVRSVQSTLLQNNHPISKWPERSSSGEGGPLSSVRSKQISPCNSSMRRNVGNGAAFNGIVKLRGRENYQEWFRAIRAAARKEGVWDMLTGGCSRPEPLDPDATVAEQRDYQDNMVYWTNKSDLALGGIEGSLEDHIQASLDCIDCPRAVWLKLERDYNPRGAKVLYDLVQKLDSLTLMDGSVEKLADGLRELKNKIDTQKGAEALPAWYYSIRFLRSLTPAYKDLISSIMDRDAVLGDEKHQIRELAFEQIVSRAIAEEQHRKI